MFYVFTPVPVSSYAQYTGEDTVIKVKSQDFDGFTHFSAPEYE
jgi:hypothetical protein